MTSAPNIAIVAPNTLAGIGLAGMLSDAITGLKPDVFGSFAELEANNPDSYFHYFVEIGVVIAHHDFFLSRHKKTIVFSQSSDPYVLSGHFHNLCVSQPGKQLLRSLLMLVSRGHSGGSVPPHVSRPLGSALSAREVEVLTLIVKGCINKEIADRLRIGVSTVITHRKNIMAKLAVKSVSSLTAYAIAHGYVDINSI